MTVTAVETAPAAKPDRRRAPETKDRILDAAESLFVQRGYYGVSLRDISSLAGLQVALSYYHFGNKEDLFRAVVERRAAANAAGIDAALDAALALTLPLPQKLEAVLESFLRPVVEKTLNGGAGWKNYVRLMAQLANLPQNETFVNPVAAQYDAVVARYIGALKTLFPAMSNADVHWAFYFYQAAITHVLAESGLIDRQSDGLCRTADLDAVVQKMARYFAAGFMSLNPAAAG